MGRTSLQKSAKQTSSTNNAGVRGSRVQKARKKHKIVLEGAGAKDEDKLRVVLSFHSDPPPGYTFIPAGNTQLTAALKMFAKRGGFQVMAVSATPHAQRHELSREVHRIGYHFPTEVVSQVCTHYGIRLDSSGRLIGEQDSEKLFMKISQKGQVVLNETIRDQVTINTEAKEIIRDLFPKIPDNDLFQIIKTAFQLGDNKVGTAEEIPLVRRAQLSVVAHIRHSYTNYDKLLRQVPYNEARHMVEKTTLMKLVEWRGNENDLTEDSRKAVDDAVREVVVLSDEDSDSELEEGQVLENEDVKVEPVKRPTQPTVTTQHRPLSPTELSSGEEAPKGYRFVPRTSQRNVYDQAEAEARARQQSRYAVWDQVRQEYQTAGSSTRDSQMVTRLPLDAPTVIRSAPVAREVVYDHAPSVRYVVEDPPPVRIFQQPTAPVLVRGADGRLYERLPARYEEPPATARRIYTPPSGTRMVPTPPNRRSASPRTDTLLYHRRTPSLNSNGVVIPSIERSEYATDSPRIRPNPVESQRAHENERRAPERRRNLIDLTSSAGQLDRHMDISPSPPPQTYVQRINNPANDVHMYDDRPAPRPRQLIELSHQPAVASNGYSSPRAGQQTIYHNQNANIAYTREPGRQDYQVPRPAYPETHQYVREPARLPERRIIYEPVDDPTPPTRPVRYLLRNGTEAPAAQQVGQRYYVAEDYVDRQRLPPGPEAYRSARPVAYDNVEAMDDVRPSGNSRYPPTYRPAYIPN